MLNLDTHKIFVFVRQDLPIAQQMVQAIHATFHASAAFASLETDREGRPLFHNGVPYVVLIGVPDAKALARVKTKLDANKLNFSEFLDTDIDSKPSAIATYPLSPEQATLLARYRLWRYSPVAQDAVSLPKSDVEHSAANRDVAGPEPSQGSQI